MPTSIRVRDVVRNAKHERGPEEPVLLIPYDLFQPVGAVRKRGDLVDWKQGDDVHSGRAVPALLKNTHPGERVLLRINPTDTDGEWWLCEIEAVDGVAGGHS